MNIELKEIVRRQRLGVGAANAQHWDVFREGSGGVLTRPCLLAVSVPFFITEVLISLLFRDERQPHIAIS